MKIRKSCMPKEEDWSIFLTELNRSLLSLGWKVVDVADLRQSYGTFSVPAARVIPGKTYAFEIEPEMIEIASKKAKELHLDNVETSFVIQYQNVQGLKI